MSAGRLILMGSGELSNRLMAAHRLGVERAGAREAVVLDTPFGFQENAPLLSERLTGFFRTSLAIDSEVASYRSTSDGEVARERMLAAVRRARYVFAGPGSPGYALATWRETGLAAALRNLLTDGATVTLASAAALTAGAKTLPVYEIFKAGAGLEWLEGLNLSDHLGLETVVIPHWNNTEGQGFDTSRCYMGRRRFQRLRAMLPDRMGVIGVDEHTAAIIDFGRGEMSVLGAGGVTLSGAEDVFVGQGETMSLDRMCGLLGSKPLATPEERIETLPRPHQGQGSPIGRGDRQNPAVAGNQGCGWLAAGARGPEICASGGLPVGGVRLGDAGGMGGGLRGVAAGCAVSVPLAETLGRCGPNPLRSGEAGGNPPGTHLRAPPGPWRNREVRDGLRTMIGGRLLVVEDDRRVRESLHRALQLSTAPPPGR